MKTKLGSLKIAVVEDHGAKELSDRLLLGTDGKPDGRMVDGSSRPEVHDTISAN